MPFPVKTGVLKIGNPDRNSPVFITGNYRLTVIKVKKALKNIDCYLLVANSHGINVWCASAGGHFTNHSIISVVKTSGIEELVDHRKLVVPQLLATGLLKKQFEKATGWKVIWGPAYAVDIEKFVQVEFKKTSEMSLVHFSVIDRFEMASVWAFPISIIALLIAFYIKFSDDLLLVSLIWGISLVLFLSFPLYEGFLRKETPLLSFKYYDLRLGIIQIVYWVLSIIGITTFISLEYNTVPQSAIINWSIFSLVLVIAITFDMLGNTPTYKSSMSEERLLSITLDNEKCKGAAFCEVVCPKGCFEVDHINHKAKIVDATLCVKCGSCVTQCPFDALYYKTPDNKIVEPDTIRRYKLNMMGKRMKKISIE